MPLLRNTNSSPLYDHSASDTDTGGADLIDDASSRASSPEVTTPTRLHPNRSLHRAPSQSPKSAPQPQHRPPHFATPSATAPRVGQDGPLPRLQSYSVRVGRESPADSISGFSDSTVTTVLNTETPSPGPMRGRRRGMHSVDIGRRGGRRGTRVIPRVIHSDDDYEEAGSSRESVVEIAGQRNCLSPRTTIFSESRPRQQQQQPIEPILSHLQPQNHEPPLHLPAQSEVSSSAQSQHTPSPPLPPAHRWAPTHPATTTANTNTSAAARIPPSPLYRFQVAQQLHSSRVPTRVFSPADSETETEVSYQPVRPPRPPPSAAPSTAFSFAAPSSVVSASASPALFDGGRFTPGYQYNGHGLVHRGSFPPRYQLGLHPNYNYNYPSLSTSQSLSSIGFGTRSGRSSETDITVSRGRGWPSRPASVSQQSSIPQTPDYPPRTSRAPGRYSADLQSQTTSTSSQIFYSPDAPPHVGQIADTPSIFNSEYSYEHRRNFESAASHYPSTDFRTTPPFTTGLGIGYGIDTASGTSHTGYINETITTTTSTTTSTVSSHALVGLGITGTQTAPPTPDHTPPQYKQHQQSQQLQQAPQALSQPPANPTIVSSAGLRGIPSSVPHQLSQNHPTDYDIEKTNTPSLSTTPPSIYASIDSGSNPRLPFVDQRSNPTLQASATQVSGAQNISQSHPHQPQASSQSQTQPPRSSQNRVGAGYRNQPSHPRAQLPLKIEHRNNHTRLHNESRADSFVTAAEDFSSSEEDPRHRFDESDDPLTPQDLDPPIHYGIGAGTWSEITVQNQRHSDTESVSTTRTPRTRPSTQQENFRDFDGHWGEGDGTEESVAEYSTDSYEYDEDAPEYDSSFAGDSFEVTSRFNDEGESESIDKEGDTETDLVGMEWKAIMSPEPLDLSAVTRQPARAPSTTESEDRRLSAMQAILTATAPTREPIGVSPALTDASRVTIKRTMSPYEPSDSEGSFSDSDIDESVDILRRLTTQSVDSSDFTEERIEEPRHVLRDDVAPFTSYNVVGETKHVNTAGKEISRVIEGPQIPHTVVDRVIDGRQTQPGSSFPSSHTNPLTQNPPSPVQRISRWSTSDSSATSSIVAEQKRHSITSTQSGVTSSSAQPSPFEPVTPPRRQMTLRHVRRNIIRDEESDGSQSPASSARESGVALNNMQVPLQQPRAVRPMVPPRSNTPGKRVGRVATSHAGVRERKLTPPVGLGTRYIPHRQMQQKGVPRAVNSEVRPVSRSTSDRSRHTPVSRQSTRDDDLHRMASVYSTASTYSINDTRARWEITQSGSVPVVLIPERNSSVKRGKESSLRSSSSHRTRGSRSGSVSSAKNLAVAYVLDGQSPEWTREPPRIARGRSGRVMSESEGDRDSNFPVHKRSSSLSPSTSQEGSLTVESIQAHNALHAQLAAAEPKYQVAFRVEPPSTLSTEVIEGQELIPGFSPAGVAHRAVHSASPPTLSVDDIKKRELMVKTPFSVASMETTFTTIETSEAKAIPIFSHQNSSVQVVDHTSSRPSDASSADIPSRTSRERSIDRGRSRTPEYATEPRTPVKLTSGLEDVDSPLRNPRIAPTPPSASTNRTSQVISPELESTGRRSLSLVRRALSRRRNSVSSTTTMDKEKDPNGNMIIRALHKRDRKYPPASGGRDVTPIPSAHPPRSNSDPAPRPHSSLFSRSRSSTGDEPRRSRSQSTYSKPPSRASSLKRSLSNRIRQTISLIPGTSGYSSSISGDEDNYKETERRVIGRSSSGTLRVMNREGDYGDGYRESFRRESGGALEDGRPFSAVGIETVDGRRELVYTPEKTLQRSRGVMSEAIQPGTTNGVHPPAHTERPAAQEHSPANSDRAHYLAHISTKGRSKTSQSAQSGRLESSLSWISTKPMNGVKSGWESLVGLPRRMGEKRREKRVEGLRGQISGPREVRDGVGEIVKKRVAPVVDGY